MLKLSRVLKDYREAGSLNALVPVQAAVSNSVFLTKAGDLLTVLRAHGPDPECMDESQINAVSRALESGMRTFGEDFRLQQYLVKRPAPAPPLGTYPNPVVARAAENRLEYFRHKADDLFSVETYLAISYEGWRKTAMAVGASRGLFGSLSELLSTKARMLGMTADLNQAIEHVTTKVNSFVVQLHDFIRFEPLTKEQAFRFLYGLLNYEPFKRVSARLRYDSFVDFQACHSLLECHRNHLKVDDYFVRVLTLKDAPVHTFAHMLRGFQELTCPYIASSEWRAEPNWRVRKLIQSKRRHFHNGKASLANYINASSSQPKDMLIDDGAVAQVNDLGACLEEMEANGKTFGQYAFSIVFYDRDQARINKAIAEAFKLFGGYGAQLLDERYNLLNAWLAVLPGNHAYNLRSLWLLNTNCADLSLLSGPETGEPSTPRLDVEHLALFETNDHSLYFLNLHHQDVAHTAVFGATGSGKSFLLNFLLTHVQKYQPLTYVFDLGGSYKTLTDLFGGAYLTLRPNEQALSINPFALPFTVENVQFLFSFVRVLAESSGYSFTPDDERDLFDQIENLYQIEPAQRRLLTLSNIVNRGLRTALQKWVRGGQYGAWFDNAEDGLTLAAFQTFDFEGMDKYPQLLEPLLFYVLHRANARIYDAEQATVFKVFVMDEAWRFLLHPTIRLYMVEALKTWRKKNAAMILATQSSEDLAASETLRTVIESCPTKIFLANPGMDRALCRELFALNDREAKIITELVPKRQILVKKPDHSKILNLNVSRKDYWLYTSDAYESEKRRQVLAKHGLSQGLDLLAKE